MRHVFFGLLALWFVLVISAALVGFIASLFNPINSTNEQPDFSSTRVIAGLISEFIRGLITYILYKNTLNHGRSLNHGIKFGLLYSSLIGSIYLILGIFYFQPEDPVKFALTDSIILVIQGITSGIVLHYIFKRKNEIT